GMNSSFAGVLGTAAPLAILSGDIAEAMPLDAMNRLSPQTNVCCPRRTVVGAEPRSKLANTNASSTSAYRPCIFLVRSEKPSLNVLLVEKGKFGLLCVAGPRLETVSYQAAALSRARNLLSTLRSSWLNQSRRFDMSEPRLKLRLPSSPLGPAPAANTSLEGDFRR